MSKRLTTEQFIEKSRRIHGDKYGYDKVEYTNNKTKVVITCPIHGDFEQPPNAHLKGFGCNKCKRLKQKSNTKEFIRRANIVHNGKYNYDKTKYESAFSKVIITCPIHGDFEQQASNHLSGRGCELCGFDSVGWTISRWELSANNSSNYDSYKLYIVNLYNEKENYIKVGRTFVRVSARMSSVPYYYSVIKIIKCDSAKFIFDLENSIKRKFKKFRYEPKISFGGETECFKIESKDDVVVFANEEFERLKTNKMNE